MTISSILNKNLLTFKSEVYDKLSFNLSNVVNEMEGLEYDACRFDLSGKKVICRSAKITPKKSEQFVTFWKRDANGITTPYSDIDSFDYYVINTNSGDNIGQFIFPKSLLIKHALITTKITTKTLTKTRDGKRGFRVYPIWDKVGSKQAESTQKWQLAYFYQLNSNTDFKRVNDLYNL